MSNTARNPITGDPIRSKFSNENYYNGYDRIFRKNKEKEEIDDKDNSTDTDISTTNKLV